jgi:hypothetical protein
MSMLALSRFKFAERKTRGERNKNGEGRDETETKTCLHCVHAIRVRRSISPTAKGMGSRHGRIIRVSRKTLGRSNYDRYLRESEGG